MWLRGANPMDLKRGIDKAVSKVVDYIKANAEVVDDNYDKMKPGGYRKR